MSYLNPNSPIFPNGEAIEAEIAQLELTVAFSSLTEPSARTIALWADQGTGTYPLTTDRGATTSCNIVVDVDDNISEVASMTFVPYHENPSPISSWTLWVNADDDFKLYLGNTQLGGGAAKFLLNGYAEIDGSNQNLISGNYPTPMYDVSNNICDVIPADINITKFNWHLSRAIDVTENINIRLLVNGNPIAILGPFIDSTPVDGSVAINVSVVEGDTIFILINSFTIRII